MVTAPASNPNVLVVDDDLSMCEMLAVSLRSEGFDVATLTSPREALERLGIEDFDVVVADLNMQGMSGLDLCREIVAVQPDLPVVVITEPRERRLGDPRRGTARPAHGARRAKRTPSSGDVGRTGVSWPAARFSRA